MILPDTSITVVVHDLLALNLEINIRDLTLTNCKYVEMIVFSDRLCQVTNPNQKLQSKFAGSSGQ